MDVTDTRKEGNKSCQLTLDADANYAYGASDFWNTNIVVILPL